MASQERYNEIYGVSSICWSPAAGCGAVETGCAAWVTETDPDTGEVVTFCETKRMTIVILDGCEGEIVSYEGCGKQAGMIVDADFCERECRASDQFGNKNCAAICAQPMNIPWYAQGATLGAGGQWDLPNMKTLLAGGKHMGLQRDMTRTTQAKHRLDTTESPAGITTTASGGTSQNATREFVWSPMNSGGARGPVTNEETRTKNVQTENTWSVNW